MPKAASSRNKRLDIAIALAVALLGMAALAMPQELLRFGPPCLISHVAEGWCPGCGMTRAAIALLHGDLASAWAFNRLSLVVLPMLLWLYCHHLAQCWRQAPALLARQ
jgi:uncharacterized membrane protein